MRYHKSDRIAERRGGGEKVTRARYLGMGFINPGLLCCTQGAPLRHLHRAVSTSIIPEEEACLHIAHNSIVQHHMYVCLYIM